MSSSMYPGYENCQGSDLTQQRWVPKCEIAVSWNGSEPSTRQTVKRSNGQTVKRVSSSHLTPPSSGAESSEQRNSGLRTRRLWLGQSGGWGPPPGGRSWAIVEVVLNLGETFCGVGCEDRRFGEVVLQQPIGVLVGPSLPRERCL